jgi:hypothetical protein
MEQKTNRKAIRLKEFDYSRAGYYFLTLCTQNRKSILGKIVGGGDLDTPKIQLTQIGFITHKYICSIEKAYLNVKVDNYVLCLTTFILFWL